MTIQTIAPREAEQHCRENKANQLIDVRTPGEYAAMHPAGARSMPLDRLDPSMLASPEGDGSAGSSIYLICGSGGRSAKACEQLSQAGVGNVFSVAGGTTAWEQAGLPVVRGAGGAISLDRQVRIIAGGLVVIGVVLGWLIHPGLSGLAGVVGAGLVFAGVTDTCGMGVLLLRMPWNRTAPTCPMSGSSPARDERPGRSESKADECAGEASGAKPCP